MYFRSCIVLINFAFVHHNSFILQALFCITFVLFSFTKLLCGVTCRILAPQPGVKPMSSEVEAWAFLDWTTREVLHLVLFFSRVYLSWLCSPPSCRWAFSRCGAWVREGAPCCRAEQGRLSAAAPRAAERGRQARGPRKLRLAGSGGTWAQMFPGVWGVPGPRPALAAGS